MKLLLYCTKAKPTLYNVLGKFITTKYMGNDFKQDGLTHPELNGKIVAECDFEVEEIYIGKSYGFPRNIEIVYTDSLRQPIYLSQKSCLKLEDICEYLNHKDGYAIHIKNLHIFDYPRDLDDYEYTHRVKGEPTLRAVLTKAPQNMRKIIAYGTDAILISIHPEWLCKILNGEKTVEVRKKVLKEMLS